MLKIYGLHTPQFFKVLWAAEELGLEYEHISVDLIKKETRASEHLARHPFGKVPVIEHNGQFLFESCAIMRYMGSLAATTTNSEMYPVEIMKRAQVDQWLDYFSFQAGRWTTNVWYNKIIGPKYFNETPDQKVIEETSGWLHNDMPVVEKHLSDNKYLAGDIFTLADVNAFTLMMGHKDAGLGLEKYKAFSQWFSAIKDRPALHKVKAHWVTENI